MDTNQPAPDFPPEGDPLRWAWVGGGTVLGAILITLFLRVVDPGFEQPALDGLVLTLSLILVGALVGYHSQGETIREAAVAGVVLVLVSLGVAAWGLGVRVPGIVIVISPFFAATVCMGGGYVGEMLQGTLEEAHVDEALDLPWVFVAVVIGFGLSTYTVFLTRALIQSTPGQDLMVFASSFFVTGLVVGYFSPGVTMVEPGIAAMIMTVLHAGFILLWFAEPPGLLVLGGALLAGGALALLGGWLGEMLQRLIRGGPGAS
jgi:hypothetical protein